MTAKTERIMNMLFLCHGIPERCFHHKGKPFPICARCTGLGVGYILSFIVLAIVGMLPWWGIILLLCPMAIDGVGQLFNVWKSTNPRRFVTGIAGGIGIFYVFFFILYEGYRLGQKVGPFIWNGGI